MTGTDENDYFGNSTSLSANGKTIAIGSYGHDNYKGTVRVYRYKNEWSQVGDDLDGDETNDYQGWSVALSSNGLTLAVGAYGHDNNKGTVRIYNIEPEKTNSINKDSNTSNHKSQRHQNVV